jgi:ABC-type sugar transport system ATPase subunit
MTTDDRPLKRGDTREDGFIFQYYAVHPETKKVYAHWLSPIAIERAKARKAKWRLANADKARAARRDWYRRKKETL